MKINRFYTLNNDLKRKDYTIWNIPRNTKNNIAKLRLEVLDKIKKNDIFLILEHTVLIEEAYSIKILFKKNIGWIDLMKKSFKNFKEIK